ncbi:uncharacterized protein [Typha angustifolia]|uniref:uncharacterized protein n=1 Tax=Typha angustifolia TaxID=59011 RepID=UPI003C2EAE9F
MSTENLPQFKSHHHFEEHRHPQQQPDQPHRPRKPLFTPQPRTHPVAWCLAAACIVFWLVVILGGLIVLIIYIVFRPRTPRLDISSATLNAAYLDTGTFLNADLTVLASFSNPNQKVDVSFSYIQLDLYFYGTMIATQVVEPFAERRGLAALRSVHLVSSEVPLPQDAVAAWRNGTAGGKVLLQVDGKFRTRSYLGRWLRFTYWLSRHCDITVGPPPGGVLLSKQC